MAPRGIKILRVLSGLGIPKCQVSSKGSDDSNPSGCGCSLNPGGIRHGLNIGDSIHDLTPGSHRHIWAPLGSATTSLCSRTHLLHIGGGAPVTWASWGSLRNMASSSRTWGGQVLVIHRLQQHGIQDIFIHKLHQTNQALLEILGSITHFMDWSTGLLGAILLSFSQGHSFLFSCLPEVLGAPEVLWQQKVVMI